jgi:hypothetical protein
MAAAQRGSIAVGKTRWFSSRSFTTRSALAKAASTSPPFWTP